MDAALAHRPELGQAAELDQAARLRVAAAGNLARPDLGLSLSTDAAVPLEDERLEADHAWLLSLDWRWPVGNDQADGRRAEVQSLADRRRVEAEQLLGSVAATAAREAAALRALVSEWAHHEQTVSLYESAVRDETERFREGVATVLDVLTTEARLLAVQRRGVELRREYAVLLAEIRHQAGSLSEASARELRAPTGRPFADRPFAEGGPSPTPTEAPDGR